ncbi:MerR family transcriptional regulator [Lichenihabitans psoromatis]|uniref:MerR family transcriptional regulator n=1 Tax=Lichenihabitans psoromatis TaxID=2528642 RepID=UPI001A947B41|nr:MerR family transcriptional regulator [Lichenihabitans psoromatis]
MEDTMPTVALKASLSDDGVSFGIEDVAKRFSVTQRTLRFYEQRGLITPDRVGRTRKYNESQIKRLDYVLSQVRLGFTLTEIKERTDQAIGDDTPELTMHEVEEQLTILRRQQAKLSESLDILVRLRQVLSVRLTPAN